MSITPPPAQYKFLLVANFKSHKSKHEVQAWLEAVAPVAATRSNLDILIAPSFPHLYLATHPSPLIACAQDVSPYPPGSYTGAVSAAELLDLGVRYSLVGHSERRRYFHESVSDVANKVRELCSLGLTPILCLGKDDIAPQLASLDESLLAKTILAYEPLEAIGGTIPPENEDITKSLDQIRKFYPPARVIYGGSVNAASITRILGLGVSGALVGSASLASSDFIAIINKLP